MLLASLHRKEEISTLALLDISLPCTFFRMELPTKNTSLCLRWILRPAPEFPFFALYLIGMMTTSSIANVSRLGLSLSKAGFVGHRSSSFFPPKQNLEHPGTPCRRGSCQVAWQMNCDTNLWRQIFGQREYEDWTFTRSEIVPTCEAKKIAFLCFERKENSFIS